MPKNRPVVLVHPTSKRVVQWCADKKTAKRRQKGTKLVILDARKEWSLYHAVSNLSCAEGLTSSSSRVR